MLKLFATGLAASFLLLPPALFASASTNNACNCSRINCNASSRTCSGNGSSDRCRTT